MGSTGYAQQCFISKEAVAFSFCFSAVEGTGQHLIIYERHLFSQLNKVHGGLHILNCNMKNYFLFSSNFAKPNFPCTRVLLNATLLFACGELQTDISTDVFQR